MRDLRLTRRAALGLLAAPALARAQGADAWPSRSIRLVVPFGPGGPTDVMARVIAPGLSTALGKPVVVENRPGASGNVGIAHAARSAADGYTLLVTSTGFVVNPTLFRNPGYDIAKDFAPITELGASPNTILTKPDSGINSVADLVARAKATPGGLNIANPGLGSTPHLTAELLRLRTGIELVQVTHQSAAQAVQAGGHFGHFSHPALHLAQCGSHVALHGSHVALHGFRQGSQRALQGSNLHLAHPTHAACTR